MIKKIFKLLKAFNGNVNPAEIAHAFAFGAILGLMPKHNLLWYLVLVFILFMRINRPAYLLMIMAGSAVSYLFDGIFDTLGYAFLTIPWLSGIFGWLLDIPFVAYTQFNNTVVMGSLLTGLILYIPLYWTGRGLVWLWRKWLAEKVRNSKLFKVLQKAPLVAKIVSLAGGK